ncbi:hypothetical protein SLA2020_021680 [Shorea laevis]
MKFSHQSAIVEIHGLQKREERERLKLIHYRSALSIALFPNHGTNYARSQEVADHPFLSSSYRHQNQKKLRYVFSATESKHIKNIKNNSEIPVVKLSQWHDQVLVPKSGLGKLP